MTDALGGPGASQSAPAPGQDARAKLRKASHDLESVFVNELFKAMRATVPDDGILANDPGQDLFTGMLDERIAQTYAGRARPGSARRCTTS